MHNSGSTKQNVVNIFFDIEFFWTFWKGGFGNWHRFSYKKKIWPSKKWILTIPVSMLSLITQLPLSRTASYWTSQPVGGTTMMSPGTKFVVEISSNTSLPLQTCTVSLILIVPLKFFWFCKKTYLYSNNIIKTKYWITQNIPQIYFQRSIDRNFQFWD